VQATIIVSPTGAFYRESQEEFAKVSKLSRGKLAIHKRCIVDAAIQGAYEQWRQFGRKLARASQLEALNPGAGLRLNFVDPEAAEAMGEQILEEFPEISVDVSVQTRDDGPNQVISPDVGGVSPIELYEASISEARVRHADGLVVVPIEQHPDGHKDSEDDGINRMFGRRSQIDQRTHIRKDIQRAPLLCLPTIPPPRLNPDLDTVCVDCGFRGYWTHPDISRTIREEDFNALMSTQIDTMRVATPDFAGAPIEGQQYRFFPDVSDGPPIWITLRQNLKRSKQTMIMRV
jgi:hypothetical protein